MGACACQIVFEANDAASGFLANGGKAILQVVQACASMGIDNR